MSERRKAITLDPNRRYAPEVLESEIPQDIDDIETCLAMGRETQDPRLALEYIQRAVDLEPDDPRVHAGLLNILRDRLKQDPYVLFLAETEKNYIITFRHSRPIVVPKTRREPEIFPSLTKTEGERILGMIWWMILGLVPVGLGAVILFPSVFKGAFELLFRRGAMPREHRLAFVTLVLASALGCAGAVLSFLLFLHLLA